MAISSPAFTMFGDLTKSKKGWEKQIWWRIKYFSPSHLLACLSLFQNKKKKKIKKKK